MSIRVILQFETSEGKCPFRKWLLSLHDEKVRAQVRARLDRLRLGNSGDHRFLGEGIQELRIHYGPGYRIYYGEQGRKIVLLLYGGIKNTQKQDIRKAKQYWQDYLRRIKL
ncbi:type II toxin-antitoxin system RelE/ParE family toxin [bacterium]|nr:type II toxin-antitoxin system RelE/ParE family toxin [bacterium]